MREKLKALIMKMKEEIEDTGDLYYPEKTVSELEAAISQHWVPVTERLPDDGEECFVSIGDRIRLAYRCRTRGIWLSVDTGDLLTGVTHWHAIEYPQPPEVKP